MVRAMAWAAGQGFGEEVGLKLDQDQGEHCAVGLL